MIYTEFQEEQKGKQKHRRWVWFLVIGSILLIVVGVPIILIAYNPRSYTPIIPEDPLEVSPYLTHKLGPDFYNNVQMDQPFELIVEQAGINDILSHTPWPLKVDGFSIYMPVVVFDPQKTVLMAQVDFKGFSSILSIIGSPYLDTEGKLNLNIQSVFLGALPITPLAQRLGQKFISEFDPGDPESADISLDAARAIIANESFDPILYISDHMARITQMSIEPGCARLMLTPVRNPNAE